MAPIWLWVIIKHVTTTISPVVIKHRALVVGICEWCMASEQRKLPDGRTQNGTSITHSRVGCGAGSFDCISQCSSFLLFTSPNAIARPSPSVLPNFQTDVPHSNLHRSYPVIHFLKRYSKVGWSVSQGCRSRDLLRLVSRRWWGYLQVWGAFGYGKHCEHVTFIFCVCIGGKLIEAIVEVEVFQGIGVLFCSYNTG